MSTTHETPIPTAPAVGRRPRTRPRTRRRTALLLAATVTTLAAVAGCSSGDDAAGDSESLTAGDAASSGSGSGGGTEMEAPSSSLARDVDGMARSDLAAEQSTSSSSEADSSSGSSDGSDVAARVPVESGLYIRTGQVTVVSADLDAARAELGRTVQRYGGQVATERTSNDDDGDLTSTRLTLRVPSARFSDVMASFAELGEVQGSESQQDEVTTEVIDVASRIRTQEVSLGRLRGFLDRATSVASIIRLESEIARREADLASLRAQQDYLEDQTSMSTIEATLRQETKPVEPAPEPDELEDAGFLTGLGNGWNALLDVLTVGATVVGALLPFALVLALVGLPLTLWLRATRRTRRAPGSPDPAV